MTYYVYLLTNKNRTVLYTGVTNNLERRLYEHINKLTPGFTSRYNVDQLIYFEQTDSSESAILREKQIKSWSRARKNQLIKTTNPQWKFLNSTVLLLRDPEGVVAIPSQEQTDCHGLRPRNDNTLVMPRSISEVGICCTVTASEAGQSVGLGEGDCHGLRPRNDNTLVMPRSISDVGISYAVNDSTEGV